MTTQPRSHAPVSAAKRWGLKPKTKKLKQGITVLKLKTLRTKTFEFTGCSKMVRY
jgi:hypothetical protein